MTRYVLGGAPRSTALPCTRAAVLRGSRTRFLRPWLCWSVCLAAVRDDGVAEVEQVGPGGLAGAEPAVGAEQRLEVGRDVVRGGGGVPDDVRQGVHEGRVELRVDLRAVPRADGRRDVADRVQDHRAVDVAAEQVRSAAAGVAGLALGRGKAGDDQ